MFWRHLKPESTNLERIFPNSSENIGMACVGCEGFEKRHVHWVYSERWADSRKTPMFDLVQLLRLVIHCIRVKNYFNFTKRPKDLESESSMSHKLRGGNSKNYFFHPYLEEWSNLNDIFSTSLKPYSRNYLECNVDICLLIQHSSLVLLMWAGQTRYATLESCSPNIICWLVLNRFASRVCTKSHHLPDSDYWNPVTCVWDGHGRHPPDNKSPPKISMSIIRYSENAEHASPGCFFCRVSFRAWWREELSTKT